jgi:hypothetical protein
MRPQYFGVYTPADDDTNGFASAVTGTSGVAFVLDEASTAGDSLGHKVIITPSGSVTGSYTITGTDANDRTQTETLATNTTNAVTSVNYYKTLTSVLAPSGIGAQTVDIGWTDDVTSPMYLVNWRQGPPFSISFGVDISGTIDYDVQHRFNNVWESSTVGQGDAGWFDHSSVAAKTADADGNYAYPITAMRVLINSLTAGATFTWFIIQGE